MKANDYALLSFAEQSGLAVGQTGDLVKLYQSMIDVMITGCWSHTDEEKYRVFADEMNWKIIKEVIKLPSFWDIGLNDIPEEELLDLEF